MKKSEMKATYSRLFKTEIGALFFISDFVVRSPISILISGILMRLRIIFQNFVQFLTSAMPWFYTVILCIPGIPHESDYPLATCRE